MGLKRREQVTPALEALGWLRFAGVLEERDVAIVKRLTGLDPPPVLAASISACVLTRACSSFLESEQNKLSLVFPTER